MPDGSTTLSVAASQPRRTSDALSTVTELNPPNVGGVASRTGAVGPCVDVPGGATTVGAPHPVEAAAATQMASARRTRKGVIPGDVDMAKRRATSMPAKMY